MELQIISLVINGLLGLAMYFMRQTHSQNREELKDLKSSVKHIENTYSKKEELKEFKEDIKELKTDLWKRFDRLEEQLSRKE